MGVNEGKMHLNETELSYGYLLYWKVIPLCVPGYTLFIDALIKCFSLML